MKHTLLTLLDYLNTPKKGEYIEIQQTNSISLPQIYPSTIPKKVYFVYESR